MRQLSFDVTIQTQLSDSGYSSTKSRRKFSRHIQKIKRKKFIVLIWRRKVLKDFKLKLKLLQQAPIDLNFTEILP